MEKMFFGAKVSSLLNQENTIDKQEIYNFQLNALNFYVELTTHLKERFNFNDVYLKFASNFTPTNAMSGEVLSVANFVNLFPNIEINIESANNEWLILSEMGSNFGNSSDITTFWKKVDSTKNSLGEMLFKDLMKIVKVILALPHSSAAAERAFSDLTLAKTKTRNSLLITTCAAILLVKDKLRKLPGGSLDWVPPKELSTYNSKAVEEIAIEIDEVLIILL
jgi:hypothetical protein